MGKYYLCQIQRARHPYYIESVGRNIWSIEELCYYMKENVYLLDETILNERLCAWLEKELGLLRLAKIFARGLETNAPAEELILPVFKESGYLSGDELTLLMEQLEQIQVEPGEVRRKMKADYLVNYKMYVRAIREYEKILQKRSPGRLGMQFYASVWENMATAYAKMFSFEEAAECLWESYQTLRSRKVYEKYLRILPLYLSENRYYARLEEIRADRDLAARMKADAAAILQEGQESAFARLWEEQSIEDMVQRLKEDYIRNTVPVRVAGEK